MRKSAFWALLLSILAGCAGTGVRSGESDRQVAKGGRYYGGVFHLNESEYIKSLYPPSIVDVYSLRVASQVYEGLFKFDQKTLDLVPALAESYETNQDRTAYTFRLRQGVKFHDDPCFPGGEGRELVADDIKYCFDRVCQSASHNNLNFTLFKGIVKGADEYYNASRKGEVPTGGVPGITVVDKYTLKIELERPYSLFLFNLARPGAFIYPREAYERYGGDMRVNCVGTGPFRLEKVNEGQSIILRRNERYYRIDDYGNQLPFLDGVKVSFLKDKKIELLEFKKGNFDMMYRLPTEQIIQIIEEVDNSQLQRMPEMSTQILALNNAEGVFKDLNVRKAFNFAIDRKHILQFVLNGEGYESGYYGLTPPSFGKDYDITGIPGYRFDLDSARYYFKQAGYDDGADFPQIDLHLNAEGERYISVAVEIKKQLKAHLNVEIELRVEPLAENLEVMKSGDYEMVRLFWQADYPSPENYLWMLYGKNVPQGEDTRSYPNITRYQNPAFDELYEKGLRAVSEEEALGYFMQAERLAMQDAPVIVLWYDEGYRLVQPYVQNFPSNPMQYRDFSEVYLRPKEPGEGTAFGQ